MTQVQQIPAAQESKRIPVSVLCSWLYCCVFHQGLKVQCSLQWVNGGCLTAEFPSIHIWFCRKLGKFPTKWGAHFILWRVSKSVVWEWDCNIWCCVRVSNIKHADSLNSVSLLPLSARLKLQHPSFNMLGLGEYFPNKKNFSWGEPYWPALLSGFLKVFKNPIDVFVTWLCRVTGDANKVVSVIEQPAEVSDCCLLVGVGASPWQLSRCESMVWSCTSLSAEQTPFQVSDPYSNPWKLMRSLANTVFNSGQQSTLTIYVYMYIYIYFFFFMTSWWTALTESHSPRSLPWGFLSRTSLLPKRYIWAVGSWAVSNWDRIACFLADKL